MKGKKIAALAGLAVAASLSVQAAHAETQAPVLNPNTASVTYGPYFRAELGGASSNLADGHWLPPGYPKDPRIDFDLSGKTRGLVGIAVGYDWMNGFRGDLSLLNIGKTGVTGPHTTSGSHADITAGSISATAVMASLYYSPLERSGSNSRLQPFVVAGLGMANNRVGSWTRTNLTEVPVNRTFNGSSNVSAALSLGVGVSYQITGPSQHPVMLELAYRYYDFGIAKGGTTADVGASTPVEPLTFRNKAGIVSVSIRIPLQHF
ncbi:outer membrane beta-barrel protein [bacterium]|nr:outer membrane beta-barrel protein [bacterium]